MIYKDAEGKRLHAGDKFSMSYPTLTAIFEIVGPTQHNGLLMAHCLNGFIPEWIPMREIVSSNCYKIEGK